MHPTSPERGPTDERRLCSVSRPCRRRGECVGHASAPGRRPTVRSRPRRRRAGARSPHRRPSRTARRARRGGRAEPLEPLINGYANTYYAAAVKLDGVQLARLPVRVDGQGRADDGRQAAARVLDPGAGRARVRLHSVEHARPAGDHGRDRGGADVRPHAAPLRPRRRPRRRPRARDHPDDGRVSAPQQPRRAADAAVRRGALWFAVARDRGRAGRDGSSWSGVWSGSASRRRWASR